MSKLRKIIIGIISVVILSIAVYITPKFLSFMETQTDIFKIEYQKTQVFQINEKEYVSDIEIPSQNIPLPEDILNKMIKRQQEKLEKERLEAERLEAERLEAERKKAEEQKKIEEEKKLEIAKQQTITKTTSRSSSETRSSNSDYIAFTATGYCPCSKCCGKSTGITASGAKAQAGVTVAMPSSYAFGTKVEIKGMGTYTVQDRGGAINGNKIDIFFNTHQEALNFGRRTVYLKVI